MEVCDNITHTSELDLYQFHPLQNKWNLYAHLPHDTDWSLKSYKLISTLNSVEEAITILNSIPDKVIKNCMLFIMKDGINPTWEDKLNKEGGCFSYKIINNNITDVWNKLCYSLIGETIITKRHNNINGLTISPKKNFCIIKVWMKDCSNKNPKTLNYFDGIDSIGCLFKKHISISR